MKQRLSLLLVFALVLSLFAGCGSQGTPEPQPATPTATETPAATEAPAAAEASAEPEETFADGYDWVPDALRQAPEETMHWDEMLELLGSAIAYCDADAVARWQEVLTPESVNRAMALVRLMMGSFDLVILDEPTAAMDMETTSLAEGLMINYVRETNCALLLVTHSLQQARRVADEALFFWKGKLLENGRKEKVLYSPCHEETKRFLEFYGI